MSAKTRWLLGALGVLLFLVLDSGSSWAQKRIVVLDIEGARSDRLRKNVSKLIRPNKTLSSKIYRRAAKRLRAPKLNPKSVKKVAAYLEADGVIDGILVAEDGGYKLTIRLRAGRDGTFARQIRMSLSKPRLSDRLQRGLRKRLMDAIDELPPLAGRGAPVGGSDEGFADEGFEEEDEDEGFEEGFEEEDDRARDDEDFDDEDEGEDFDEDFGDDDDDDDDDEDFGDDDEGFDDEEGEGNDGQKWQDPRTRSVIVMAGASITKRTLKFTYAQELENPPPGYASGNVPGAYVNGIVFPLALGEKKGKKGKKGAEMSQKLGITFFYDRVLNIATNVQDGDTGEVTEVGTQAERWGLGGAYRILLGQGEGKPSVTLLAGYNKSKFIIDKAMSPVEIDVPNTSYVWVDPGARFRMPVTKEAALHGEAHALLVLDTGEMQELEQYGAAKVTGVDADVGLEYWLTPRYLLRLGARYTALGFDYQGNGVLTDRNNDNEVDVGGALDSYLGGYVTIGAGF